MPVAPIEGVAMEELVGEEFVIELLELGEVLLELPLVPIVLSDRGVAAPPVEVASLELMPEELSELPVGAVLFELPLVPVELLARGVAAPPVVSLDEVEPAVEPLLMELSEPLGAVLFVLPLVPDVLSARGTLVLSASKAEPARMVHADRREV